MEKQEKRWYIIQTYSGFEDSVERDLKKRIETMEMQDYIFNVLIPTETTVEVKADGSKKEKVKKLYPGYIFVEMIVTDDQGNEKVMKILFTYDNDERKKSYVFLYEKDDEDNVMAFAYNEENQSLEEIEDDDEYAEVEEVFNAFNEDPKIQEAKN